MPMLFWLNASDFMIQAVCWAGAGFSLLVVFNLLPRLSLFFCLPALSLADVCAARSSCSISGTLFCWKAGFLALLLNFATRPGIWLLRWLLFRFMFMSGVVKLSSGDPNWWNLTALHYHFLTQPLPTPLAWYAAHMPAGLLTFATGATFVVELVLPFLIFCPRRLRFAAAFGMLLLESLILLTGNYNWFNLQTMLLCLLLFDDAALARDCCRTGWPDGWHRANLRGRCKSAAGSSSARWPSLILFCGLVEMDERFGGEPPGIVQDVGTKCSSRCVWSAAMACSR